MPGYSEAMPVPRLFQRSVFAVPFAAAGWLVAWPSLAADLNLHVQRGTSALETRAAVRSLETWETRAARTGPDGRATVAGLAPGIYMVIASDQASGHFVRHIFVLSGEATRELKLEVSDEAPNAAFTLTPGSFAKMVLKEADGGPNAVVPEGIAELRRELALWEANIEQLSAVFSARQAALLESLPKEEQTAIAAALGAASTRRGKLLAVKARSEAAREGTGTHATLRRLLLLHEARANHAVVRRDTRRAIEDLEEQLAD